MHFRTVFLVCVIVAGTFVIPSVTHAAAIPFFGPIIPAGSASCPAGWGMLMIVINNIIRLLITLAIVFVAPIMIAWSGFLLVTNPFNASGKEQAKKILTNTVVGIVLALAGWLIVNALMAVLYDQSKFGTTWSQLITSSGSLCLVQEGVEVTPGVAPPTITVTPPTGPVTPGANCPVPDQSTMVAIPAQYVVGGTGLATPTTVQNYLAMRTAALQAGFDLKVSSSYRSDATQVTLWNQYCSSGTCGATLVAKPCSLGGPGSNHNSGQALDLTDGCTNGAVCNTAAYQWLKANGGNWGFYNALPEDGIHWSPSGR